MQHGTRKSQPASEKSSSLLQICFSVQNAVRVSLRPAVACDPHGPIQLDVLGQRSEAPLQRIDTLIRCVRAKQERNTRKPSSNVEVIYSRACAADEQTPDTATRRVIITIVVVVVAECSRERLEYEDFDGVPESDGRDEEIALGVFCCFAVEQRMEFGDRRDILVVECFVYLRLWNPSKRFQCSKP